MERLPGWERGNVTAVDYTNTLVTANILGGPEVTVPFLADPPAVGSNAWFVEIASGSLLCIGSIGLPPVVACHAYSVTPTTVPNGGATTVQIDTLDIQQPYSGLWVLAANILTLPFTGMWMLHGKITWASNVTGQRYTDIFDPDHSLRYAVQSYPTDPTGAANSECNSPVMTLASGTRIELRGRQTSGGNLATAADASAQFGQAQELSALFLGPNIAFP